MASVNCRENPTSSANGEETKREITDECEITWEHIQDIHHRLASHKEKRPPTGTGKDDATLKILQHKQYRLQAQLDIIKKQDLEVTSKDLQFVETLLWDDLMKRVAQQQESLVIVKGQRLEVASDIAREKILLEEQKAIQRSLKEKLLACSQQQDDNEQTPNSVLAKLQGKKKQADKYHTTVMNQMGQFLSKHFPAPNDNDSEVDYCSLQHIIETLMNRLFESPHNCYVEILPKYWPPYIQLLLHANIVQRHPENCSFIKLVAFHA